MYSPKPVNGKTISNTASAPGVDRAGYAFASFAYVFWGVAPVYFVWVGYALPLEVLAQRIVWSVPLLLALVLIGRQWRALRQLQRNDFIRLAACSVLLSLNWLTFIYAIQQGHIAETSLGYFINPLVSIALGALFLRERLAPLQWAAVSIPAVALGYELLHFGFLPWVALTLAFTFGFYGLLRKQVQVPAALGLALETVLLVPVALVYLYTEGAFIVDDHIPPRDAAQLFALACGGFVTVVPLVCFGAAAARLPLITLGFFQYLAPSISLLLAVIVYAEQVPVVRWISFAAVWAGIVLFSLYSMRLARRARLNTV